MELKDKIMRIWHISDSHSFEKEYNIPDGIDVICYTGDESNNHSQHLNHNEFLDFVRWYAEVPVQHKLFIPGNHSSFCYHNEKEARSILKEHGITWLHKEEYIIDGVKFYGDGTSPSFGNWYYMCKRETINRHWELIPDDTNVLLTHTPPKGILDLTENRDHSLEMCGCSSLGKRVRQLKELKYHCFGHIHSFKHINNTGFRVIDDVIYSNATGVEDGRFEKGIVFYGNIMTI